MKGTHNGFHGRTSWQARGKPGETISKRVAFRLNKLVCGVDSCQCGEHIANDNGYNEYRLPDTENLRGRYPTH